MQLLFFSIYYYCENEDVNCLILQYIDHQKGVQVASEKLYLLQGDSPQICNWEEYGFQIQFQQNTLLSSATCEIGIQALVGGLFQLPPNTELVSAIYAVSFAANVLRPVKIGIQHCVQLNNDDQAQYLSFAIAPINPSTLPYNFEIFKGGTFTSHSRYGFIVRDTFCLVAILKFFGFYRYDSDDSSEDEGMTIVANEKSM